MGQSLLTGLPGTLSVAAIQGRHNFCRANSSFSRTAFNRYKGHIMTSMHYGNHQPIRVTTDSGPPRETQQIPLPTDPRTSRTLSEFLLFVDELRYSKTDIDGDPHLQAASTAVTVLARYFVDSPQIVSGWFAQLIRNGTITYGDCERIVSASCLGDYSKGPFSIDAALSKQIFEDIRDPLAQLGIHKDLYHAFDHSLSRGDKARLAIRRLWTAIEDPNSKYHTISELVAPLTILGTCAKDEVVRRAAYKTFLALLLCFDQSKDRLGDSIQFTSVSRALLQGAALTLERLDTDFRDEMLMRQLTLPEFGRRETAARAVRHAALAVLAECTNSRSSWFTELPQALLWKIEIIASHPTREASTARTILDNVWNAGVSRRNG